MPTMMIDLLAQTQPAGWRTWGAPEWIAIIGAMSTAICAIIAALAALRKSDRAETNSVNANANASAARTSADHAGNIAAEARGMTATSVPIPTMPLSPPTPTPEAIQAATAAADQPEQP